MTYTARKTAKGDKVVEGVMFESWQTGVSQYRMISKDGTLRVGRNYNRLTYFASVNDVRIGDRYQTEIAALKAAVNYKAA